MNFWILNSAEYSLKKINNVEVLFMEISDILFKRIEVGANQKLFSESYDCENLINSVAKILLEILRVFMQILKILM